MVDFDFKLPKVSYKLFAYITKQEEMYSVTMNASDKNWINISR